MLDNLARELAQAAIDWAWQREANFHDAQDVPELAAVLKARALAWIGAQPLALRMLAWKAGLTDRVKL